MTTTELLPEILKLNYDERLVIADALWRSLHGEKGETEDEFKAELDRRAEEMDAHPESAVSWDDLEKELDRM